MEAMAKEPKSSKHNADEVPQDCLAASNTSAMVKSAFRIWISEGYSKQRDPNSVIDSLDKASEKLLYRRLSYISLWEISNPGVFSNIYKTAMNDKLFRVTDRKTYSAFIQNGQLYLKFLKSKPDLNKATIDVSEIIEKPSRSLTIKEAIMRVLGTAQYGLTVEEIYNKIVENGLYAFGAQNPKNVVRNIIEYSCENSNYTIRDSTSSFRFERGYDGKKVYFLLPQNATITVAGKTVSAINEPVASNSNFSASTLEGIIDLDEGKSGIREILTTQFQSLYGYSNINILWNAAQSSLSMFLNDNAINSVDALWALLCHTFSGEFILSSPHIWQCKPDYPQSMIGIVINLARQHGGVVTREQIDDYFSRIRINVPINTAILRQGLLLFYANKKFILTEIVNLTDECCDAITKALDRLFSVEDVPYIVLRDISEEWFSHLPEIKGGILWTVLLLQEVLRIRPNIGYRVITSGLDGQSLDTLGVAIVPSKSGIVTFADVVHRFCYEKFKLPKRMLAEELRLELREAGMLEGNELIYNIHKALIDYRFGFTDENKSVKILER
jgi:hypothetical protein